MVYLWFVKCQIGMEDLEVPLLSPKRRPIGIGLLKEKLLNAWLFAFLGPEIWWPPKVGNKSFPKGEAFKEPQRRSGNFPLKNLKKKGLIGGTIFAKTLKDPGQHW